MRWDNSKIVLVFLAAMIVGVTAPQIHAGTIVDLGEIISTVIADPNPARNDFYAANEGEDAVVRFNSAGEITGIIRDPLMDSPHGLAIAPDGSELYVTWPTDHALHAYSLPDLVFAGEVDLPTFVFPRTLIATSTRIYVVTREDQLAIIDRTTFEILYLGTPQGAVFDSWSHLTLSPDETRLILSGYSAMVMVDVSTDLPIVAGNPCSNLMGFGTNLAFSPDGSRLYTATGDITIFKMRDNGLLHPMHDIPIGSARHALLSHDGAILYTIGKGNGIGEDLTLVHIDTETLLPFHVEPISDLGVIPVGMALSSDGWTLAVPIDNDLGNVVTAVELVDVTMPETNRGGYKIRILDDLENRPFQFVDSAGGSGCTGYIDIEEGIWSMVSLGPGSQSIEIWAGTHFSFFIFPEIIAGEWDDLGEVVMERAPGSVLLDPPYICIEEPLEPGVQTSVTLHSLNLMNGVSLLQVDGDPLVISQTTNPGWAKMTAEVTLAPDHLPGWWGGGFQVLNPGGIARDGVYHVAQPFLASLGFAAYVVEFDEDVGSAEVAVERLGNSAGEVSIDFETSDGTAVAGFDYTETSGTLTWPDGDTSTKFISIPITDDGFPELPETFEVLLFDPTEGAVASGARAEVRIIDPDVSMVEFTSGFSNVDEDVGTLEVEVTRTGGLDSDASVQWQTVSGTAGPPTDYIHDSGTLSWLIGEDEPRTIEITIVDDASFEFDETFTIELSGPSGSAILGDIQQHEVLISDDDILSVSFSSATYSVDEGVGLATVEVLRTGGSNGVVTVGYDTSDGTAVAGSDYTAASGILSWPSGNSTPKTIEIPINNDSMAEFDEWLSIDLSSPTGGAVLGNPSSAQLTIEDNDGTAVHFGQPQYHGSEGGADVEITVDRTGSDSAGPAAVEYSTVDDTATAGQDYVATSGTLSWADGETGTKTFAVTILEDGLLEGFESFNVTLTNPTGNTTLGSPATAAIDITDNEWVEQLVNTESNGPQTYPAVAMNATGDSVIVWESYLQDGAGWGIFGQRFDADGSAVGSEFQVNSAGAGDQRHPAAAMRADGTFTVVWLDTAANNIHGRRFNATGAPVGGDFTVNTTTSGNQTEADVAVDGTGVGIVVWQSDAAGDLDIRGRRLDASGAPTGAEFAINTTTADDQQAPAIAGAPSGGFVVAWQGYGQDGPADGIIARLFASNGTPAGSEFVANEWTAGHQISPAVDRAADGSFLVAWEDTTNKDGSGSSIRARWFDATGTPSGGDVQANTYWLDNQMNPTVACSGPEKAIIAWESENQDGSNLGIYSQALGHDGVLSGVEQRMNTFVTGTQYRPAVADSATGAFWAIWASGAQDGSGDGIYGLFSAAPVITFIFADGFELGDTSQWSGSTP